MAPQSNTGMRSAFARAATWLAVFSAASNMLLLAVPIYLIQIYSNVLPTQSFETLVYLSLLMLAALAIQGAMESLRLALAQRLGARYELSTSQRLLTAGLRKPGNAELSHALVETGHVRQLLTSRAFVSLFDLPFVPLFIALMFLAHPSLGVLILVGATALIGLAVVNQIAVANTQEAGNSHQRNAGRFASAALAHDEDVRAMGMSEPMLDRWQTAALSAAHEADRGSIRNATFFGLTRFLRQALQIGVLGLGAYLVLTGHMSAGLIFAASIVAGKALSPMEQLIGNWRQLMRGWTAQRAVSASLGGSAQPQTAESLQMPEPEGRLSATGVSYVLGEGPSKQSVLSEVDIDVEPGEIVALIGASGAGKSTLARLLAGVAEPTDGEVRLDGFVLSQWRPAQRGQAIGYMGQSVSLLDGTVAENIARFDAQALDKAVIEAAQRAHAHSFIAQLPQGYETVIGPDGVRLSGGQLQRLALARALYGNPKLLILDEPNAHLDADGEKALSMALEDARRRGCAALIISQRRGLVNLADRVFLLKSGRLARLEAGKVTPFRSRTQATTPGPDAEVSVLHGRAQHLQPAE